MARPRRAQAEFPRAPGVPSCAGPALPAGHGLRTIHRTPHARFASDPRLRLGSATRDHLPVALRQSARAREMTAALQPDDGTDRAVFEALIIPPPQEDRLRHELPNTRDPVSRCG